MTTERCECCELPVYSCGKAKEAEQRRETQADQARLEQQGWVRAVYPGKCARCSELFVPGELIRMDPARGWIAECCADGER